MGLQCHDGHCRLCPSRSPHSATLMLGPPWEDTMEHHPTPRFAPRFMAFIRFEGGKKRRGKHAKEHRQHRSGVGAALPHGVGSEPIHSGLGAVRRAWLGFHPTLSAAPGSPFASTGFNHLKCIPPPPPSPSPKPRKLNPTAKKEIALIQIVVFIKGKGKKIKAQP